MGNTELQAIIKHKLLRAVHRNELLLRSSIGGNNWTAKDVPCSLLEGTARNVKGSLGSTAVWKLQALYLILQCMWGKCSE